MNTQSVPHTVNRLVIDVDQPYERFRDRYEEAVPRMSAERIQELVARRASWEEVTADAAVSAPHQFFLYWSLDVAPLMGLAGHGHRCTEYLMGNHTVAERMFRHDPAIMLYAPLRTAIYVNSQQQTCFAIDQPSTRFASFENPAISAVGVELDGKVAALLEALDVPVPEALNHGGPTVRVGDGPATPVR